jgi:hypothetical protein
MQVQALGQDATSAFRAHFETLMDRRTLSRAHENGTAWLDLGRYRRGVPFES